MRKVRSLEAFKKQRLDCMYEEIPIDEIGFKIEDGWHTRQWDKETGPLSALAIDALHGRKARVTIYAEQPSHNGPDDDTITACFILDADDLRKFIDALSMCLDEDQER